MAFIRADDGRAFLAQQIHDASEIHLAWGSGDPSWSSGPPDPSPTATALTAEVGRRRATEVEYVVPDGAGSIDLGDLGTYTISLTPTRYVYMRFTFDLVDGVGEDIREVGVFLNSTIDGAVPPGQDYVVPAEVTDGGTLFSLAHLSPVEQFTVSGVVRPQWSYLYSA